MSLESKDRIVLWTPLPVEGFQQIRMLLDSGKEIKGYFGCQSGTHYGRLLAAHPEKAAFSLLVESTTIKEKQ